MELDINNYKELSNNIKLIKENLIIGVKTNHEINDLNIRLDILSDFLSTYYNLLEEEKTVLTERMIRKIKSDIFLSEKYI